MHVHRQRVDVRRRRRRINGSPAATGPAFTSCVFEGNHSGQNGGAVSNDGVSPSTFTDCQFLNNSATGRGGGMYDEDFASPIAVDCLFEGNSAGDAGGGVYHFNDGLLTMRGCTLDDNSAPLGAGLMNHRGVLDVGGCIAHTMVNGMNLRISAAQAGASIGTLTVNGQYRHAVLGSTGDQSPTLFVDIGGLVAGTQHDVLVASGGVQIDGGALVLGFVNGFAPRLGDWFDVIQAPSISGTFDLIGVGGAPLGLGVEVSYLANAVRVTMVAADPPIFSASPTVPLTGTPTCAVMADINLDGFEDLAVSVDDPLGTGAGGVLIFINAGVDGAGQWLGFDHDSLLTLVGNHPIALDFGHFNGDVFPDLVVANRQDATVSVLQNLSGSGFVLVQNYGAGGEATAVDAGPLVGGGVDDFVVSNRTTGAVRVYRGDGNFTFTLDTTLAPPPLTSGVVIADGHVAALSPSSVIVPPSAVNVFRLVSGVFEAPVSYPVGRSAMEIIATDLNVDGQAEIVTADQGEDAVSVMLASVPANGVFLPATAIPVQGEPIELTPINLDDDLDNDVAVVSVIGPGASAKVKGIVTEVQINGEVHLTVSDLPVQPESPFRLCASDVDNDGDEDLVVINSTFVPGRTGRGGNSVQVLVAGVEPVLGDINGDGIVNVLDLLAVIVNWGPCPGSCPPSCAADIAPLGPPTTGDCTVNVLDLLMVITNWG